MVANSLDYSCYDVLFVASTPGGLEHPSTHNMAQYIANGPKMAAINRLLELGLITTEYSEITDDIIATFNQQNPSFEKLLVYQITSFGRVVLDLINELNGLSRWVTKQGFSLSSLYE